MLNQIQVGQQAAGDGGIIIGRAGRQGDAIISQLHGQHYEQTVRGAVFSVNTQGTSVTTTAALNTTWTGLAVSNPVGSGVNLVFLKMTVSQFSAATATTIGIMGGVGVLTASLAPQSRLIGSGTASKANASASATISTPLLIMTVGNVGSLATTGYGMEPADIVDLDGSIIVPPGSFIATYTGAATAGLNFGFCWAEVPV